MKKIIMNVMAVLLIPVMIVSIMVFAVRAAWEAGEMLAESMSDWLNRK